MPEMRQEEDNVMMSNDGEPDNINQITETSLSENILNNARIPPPRMLQDPPPNINLFKLRTQVLASLSVSLGSMVVGFASAYSSPALASMTATNTTMTPTKQEESWIGSLMPLCAIIGGIAGGPLIELIGRKTTILATALPFIASWLLIGFAVNIPMIYVGRSLAGICVGIASLCLPVYLGETLQPEVRGMLGLLPTTIGNMGMLVCFIAGKYMNWSTLALFGATLPVPFMILMFMIPETPRWYISKNKDEQAKKALQWLRGKDVDIKSELTVIMKTYIEEQKHSTVSRVELFKSGNLKLIAISLGLMFFQQMSGINAVVFYTVSIFKDAGGAVDEFVSTIIMGVVNVIATFFASLLIDRIGRKVLLYISGSVMILALSVLGTFLYLQYNLYDVGCYGWVPLTSIITYITGFSFGYGPVPWLMMGEILPVKIRGASASIVTGFNWSFTFIVTKTFKDLTVVIGDHGTFWVFAVMCAIGIVFVFFCVPETQGRTLDDIEKRFKAPARRMSSLANIKPLPMAI